MAGGSKLVLGEEGDHFARLEDGQALFTLHHDASEPFTVAIGEDRLVDIDYELINFQRGELIFPDLYPSPLLPAGHLGTNPRPV